MEEKEKKGEGERRRRRKRRRRRRRKRKTKGYRVPISCRVPGCLVDTDHSCLSWLLIWEEGFL